MGVGGNIANLLFMFFIASCSVIGHVGRPRVVGRRDRAGCQALGKGLRSPNCSSHHILLVSFCLLLYCSPLEPCFCCNFESYCYCHFVVARVQGRVHYLCATPCSSGVILKLKVYRKLWPVTN